MKKVLCYLIDLFWKSFKKIDIEDLSKATLKLGIGFFIVGCVMNMTVVAVNGGKMPVFGKTVKMINKRHCQGNEKTKLKFLADYIKINSSKFKTLNKTTKLFFKTINFPYENNAVASPGDIALWLAMISLLLSLPLFMIKDIVLD